MVWSRAESLLAVALATLMFSLVPGARADAPTFPSVEHDLFLTGEAWRGPTVSGDETPLLLSQEPGAAGTAQLLPVLQILNLGANSQSWYWDEPWPVTSRLVSDPVAILHVRANVVATASFTVSLSAVSPDGHPTVLGEAARTFNLPTLLARQETFGIPAADAVIPAGHVLRFTVTFDDIDVIAILDYGSANPSGITFVTKTLDSDVDGVPDDDDDCPLVRDCDGDGTDDGDDDSDGDGLGDSFEYNYYNTTHVHDHDSDGDGTSDGDEDDDGDSVTNFYEYVYGTDPHDPDSDGDGVTDGEEIDNGTDPNDPDTDDDGTQDGDDTTPGTGPSPAVDLDSDPEPYGGATEPILAAGGFATVSALTLLLLLRRF